MQVQSMNWRSLGVTLVLTNVPLLIVMNSLGVRWMLIPNFILFVIGLILLVKVQLDAVD